MGEAQHTDAWCAAASLKDALRVLGVRAGQHRLARLLGCTDDGADESDVLEALARLGCAVDVLETDRRRDALDWLCKVAYVAPVLLCVDDWGHWVHVAGGCARRLWLFDPSKEPWNTCEGRVWPLLPKTIAKRWKAARRLRGEGGLYYGIAILSCDSRKARAAVRR